MNDEFLNFAHRLADAAGAAIMPFYRTGLAVENKGSPGRFDPVTAADRAAETAMRAPIAEHYPDHGMIGEEFGRERVEAEFVWVLDPVDGTKSFMTGIPLWGTLIGLLHEGKPVLGMSAHPLLGERFWGDGHTAYGRSASGIRRLSTRRPVTLSDAVICAGSSAAFVPQLHERLVALASSARMIRYGADCYDTCMLAEGHIDAILHQGLDIYDIAAGVPALMAQSAGSDEFRQPQTLPSSFDNITDVFAFFAVTSTRCGTSAKVTAAARALPSVPHMLPGRKAGVEPTQVNQTNITP